MGRYRAKKRPFQGKHFGQARVSRKKRGRRIKAYLVLALALLLLFGLAYAVFKTSLFRIQSFVVKTSADTDHEKLVQGLRLQIAETRLGGLFGTNHYLAWPAKIPNPPIEFTSINIDKSLSKREITINAVPRTKYGLWCTEKPDQDPAFTLAVCYWLDPNGIIFKEGPMAGGQLVPTIYEQSSDSAAPSKTPVPTTPIPVSCFQLNWYSGSEWTVNGMSQAIIPVTISDFIFIILFPIR